MNLGELLENTSTGIDRSKVKWATSAPIAELEKLIVDAKNAYYNSDKPLMSDDTYDAIEDILRKRKPKSKALKTGAAVKDKVKLPFTMGSQNKVKTPEAFDKWIDKNPTDSYVVTDKLDGISFLYVHTKDGHKLYTRGDGKMGRDISAFIPHFRMPLPKIPQGAAVRGELIMSEASFNKIWAKHYANARNLVAGVTNRNDIHKALKNIRAVTYELVNGGDLYQQLRTLHSWGFEIVKYKVVLKHDLQFNKLVEMLNERKDKSRYAIDGLVVQKNENVQRNKTGNPSYAFAFKQNVEADMQVVKVVKVHWRESRLGKLKPRVEIEPTKLGGVTVKFATAHNAKYIQDNGIGAGAEIKIVRSGDVIPYIVSVEKKVTPDLPEVPFMWDGVEAVQMGRTNEQAIREIEHFFVTLDIAGLRYGSIKKLYNAGFGAISRVVGMSREDMIEVLGKNGGKAYDAMQQTLFVNGVELNVLMDASGIFPGLGSRKLAEATEAFPDLYDKRWGDIYTELQDLPGWSEVTAKKVSTGMPQFKYFVNQINVKIKKPQAQTVTSNSLSGVVVLMTGFRDKVLDADIKENGGKVAGSFSKSVTVVLAPVGTSNNKTQKAEEKGVPVMTPDAFRAKYAI